MKPIKLLIKIIGEHKPKDIWQDSPLIGYRLLENTNRGAIGEEFIRRFLHDAGFKVSNGNRTSETDMKIGSRRFEVKTASLGSNGTFQFNHVRFDRSYDYLLCLGICPQEIVFRMWRKDDLVEGHASKTVGMAKGQSTTKKITKKLTDMQKIEDLPKLLEGEK